MATSSGSSLGSRVQILSHAVSGGVPYTTELDVTALYWDLRKLPNLAAEHVPNYATITGADPRISAFVFDSDAAQSVWLDVVNAVKAADRSKGCVLIFGCTSGQHRSQAFALRAAAVLFPRESVPASVLHLDWPTARSSAFPRRRSYDCELCGASLDACSLTAHIGGKKHSRVAAKAAKRARRAATAATATAKRAEHGGEAKRAATAQGGEAKRARRAATAASSD